MNIPILNDETVGAEKEYIRCIVNDMYNHKKHFYTNAYYFNSTNIEARITIELKEQNK